MDREADFFARGGHSLLAVTLVARVCQALGVNVQLGAFLRDPTIRALAAAARASRLATAGPAPVPAAAPLVAPLTAGQRRMWFQHHLDESGSGHNIVIALRVRGRMDAAWLERKVADLFARHPSLRTVFREEGGELRQVVRSADAFAGVFAAEETVPGESPETLETSLLAREDRHLFDLETGPLVRARWVSTGPDQGLFLFTLHHLVADEASCRVLLEELGEDSPVSGPVTPLTAFALSEAEAAGSNRPEIHRQWWREYLAGAPLDLPLPFDARLPARASFRGRRRRWILPPATRLALQAFLRRAQVTPFMGFLGAWGVFLGRLCGCSDLLVGAPVSLRAQPAWERAVGFLLNTLPFRVRWSAEESFSALAGRLRSESVALLDHLEYPFDELVRDLGATRSAARAPVYQTMCVVNTNPLEPPHWPELECELVDHATAAAKVDLVLHVHPHGEEWSFELEYRTDVWREETMERWGEAFGETLALLAGEAESPLGALVASRPETAREGGNLLSALRAVVARSPDAVAVRAEGVSWTYDHLWSSAGRVATALRARGIGRGDRVVWQGPKDPAAIAAILGILRGGAAYVPLDPTFPAERCRLAAEDAAPAVILASASAATGARAWAIAPVLVLEEAMGLDGPPESEAAWAGPDETAYLIYTSGSTGRPKGVVVTHANLAASTRARETVYGLPPGRFLHLSSLAFDSAVAGLFWTLTSGGTLILPSVTEARDPAALVALMRQEGACSTLAIPSFYREILAALEDAGGLSLVRVVVAGEACSPTLVAEHFAKLPEVELWNEYGPTEATVWATVHRVDPADAFAPSVPIGRPIPGLTVELLDADRRPVASGESGELWIGGPGVGQGYWNLPEATEAAFRILPGIGRAYRTGDLASWRGDGLLCFHGRVDRQIKINGFRVEIEEVEALLRRHPAVGEVLVRAEPVIAGEEEAAAVIAHARSLLGDAVVAAEVAALGGEGETTPTRRLIRERFEILLRERAEDFLQTPRKAQRDWMIGQALEELAADLEHLDRLAPTLVPGQILALERDLEDVSGAILSPDEIMEDWQVPLMRAMAREVTQAHGDVLEIGFGRGVSADFIQQAGVRSHTIVEMNDHSVEHYFRPWRARYPEQLIHLHHGRWQDVVPSLGLFDGIFFHAFPMNEEEFMAHVLESVTFAEHAFPAMAARLRPGGCFTYLTTEIDSLSRRHQRALLRHFRSLSFRVEPVRVPPETRDAWWASSMVVIKAVKG
jgi:amino acid adenylation domain-containing protein